MNSKVILMLGIVLAGAVGGMFAFSGSLPALTENSSPLTLTEYEFRGDTLWVVVRANENVGVWAFGLYSTNGTQVGGVTGKQAITEGESVGRSLEIVYGPLTRGEYLVRAELWDYGFTKNLPDISFTVTF